MYRLRFLIIFTFILFSITTVFAQGSTPVVKPTEKNTTAPILLATVNIFDAKIISQDAHTLTVGFDITNRTGVQTGVKYAVQLISEKSGKQVLVDQKVYDEVLTLSENSSLHKEVVYIAPQAITGTYTVLVTSSNVSGFPLGVGLAGKASFSSSKGVQIATESCSIASKKNPSTYDFSKSMNIESNDQITLTCSIANTSANTVEVTPFYQTLEGSIYGKTVNTEAGMVVPISFVAGEKKTISFVLPKPEKPQIYTALVGVKTENTVSNLVAVPYIIKGPSATIMNASLDKDYYDKYQLANITIVWARPGSDAVGLKAVLTDDKGKSCAREVRRTMSGADTSGVVQIPAFINAYCYNPKVSVTLSDKDGVTLDQKDFAFTTTSSKRMIQIPSAKVLLVGVLSALVLVGAFIGLMKYRKQRKMLMEDSSKVRNLLLIIIVGSFFLFGAPSAHADTFYIGSTGAYAVVNNDKPSYAPGDTITATGYLYTGYANADTVYLDAATAGQSGVLFQSGNTPGSNSSYYGFKYFTAPGPGSYNTTFTGGVNIPLPSTPTITGAWASTRPVTGGTIDDYVECSANLDAATLYDITIEMNYETRYGGNTSGDWANCSVTIPAGYSSYTGDPVPWAYAYQGYGYYINRACAVNAYNQNGSVPIAPGASC